MPVAVPKLQGSCRVITLHGSTVSWFVMQGETSLQALHQADLEAEQQKVSMQPQETWVGCSTTEVQLPTPAIRQASCRVVCTGLGAGNTLENVRVWAWCISVMEQPHYKHRKLGPYCLHKKAQFASDRDSRNS
jgi:hypothetical protein